MKKKIIIIGIGNQSRMDDAVGLYVAKKLRKRKHSDVHILEHQGGMTNLIKEWKDFDTAIICDAVHSDQKIGTIFRFKYPEEEIPEEIFQFSTHTFSLGQVLELAQLLYQLPSKVLIYGIEGKFFIMGDGLSPPVKAAADTVIEEIDEVIIRERTSSSKYA